MLIMLSMSQGQCITWNSYYQYTPKGKRLKETTRMSCVDKPIVEDDYENERCEVVTQEFSDEGATNEILDNPNLTLVLWVTILLLLSIFGFRMYVNWVVAGQASHKRLFIKLHEIKIHLRASRCWKSFPSIWAWSRLGIVHMKIRERTSSPKKRL